jgi:hypothetical protein
MKHGEVRMRYWISGGRILPDLAERGRNRGGTVKSSQMRFNNTSRTDNDGAAYVDEGRG